MKRIVPVLGLLLLSAIFSLAYRFPGAWGGWLEFLCTFAFPALLLEAVFRGRKLGYAYLALFLGLVGIFFWVPHTIASKGGLNEGLAWLGGILFFGWEALGFTAVVALSRFLHQRRGALGAALGAAFGILVWERFGFHIYQWSWGAALGSLPWTARSAAFLPSYGLSALTWGCAAWCAAGIVEGRAHRAFGGFAIHVGVLVLLGMAWNLLPRGPEHRLDVVMVQPNFVAGERFPGMEQEMWRRTDAALASARLPRPGTATLVLWPESSVLGRDDRIQSLRLQSEAANRHVAWLYGTEGGLYNLLRGEAEGRPTFLQSKTQPMPFGERMPGPAWLRRWLDRKLDFVSQEPGALSPGGFVVPPAPGSAQGQLHVAPLICSEALDPERAREGMQVAGGELLSNHTNDGWFDRSPATDLHAAQIRLRATELGVPLLRCTLSGKSGLYREDGRGGLWGQPLSEANYVVDLAWRPISTPSRSPWMPRLLLLILGGGCLALLLLPKRPTP